MSDTAQHVETRRIIFADFAVVKYQSIMHWLERDGFTCDAVTEPPKFLAKIAEEAYDICVLNLLLGGIGPFELIKNVRTVSKNPNISVIVISRQVQKTNIQNTMRAGANDFVADPVDPENLYNRILYHLAPKQEIEAEGLEKSEAGTKEAWPFMYLLLEATEHLSRTEPGREHGAFMKVLGDIARLVDSNRTSLMIVDEESDTGVVLASSDDPSFFDFPVSLQKYPEVLHVMHSGNFVLIDDVSQNVLTQKIHDSVRTISIGSIMVFPVRFAGDVVGVLTIRRPEARELPSMDVLRVLQALANAVAAQSNIKARLRRIYKDYVPKKAS